MNIQQNNDFLQYMYERFECAKFEEAENIIKYLRDLGFNMEADTMQKELDKSVANGLEDNQMKQDIIQGK